MCLRVCVCVSVSVIQIQSADEKAAATSASLETSGSLEAWGWAAVAGQEDSLDSGDAGGSNHSQLPITQGMS